VAELSRTLDEVFRREKGRVVGGLVRALGGLDAAEEAFQEAVLAAIRNWGSTGTPDNPAAWLTTAAKNFARDAERHRRIVERAAPLLGEDDLSARPPIESVSFNQLDDELRLIFTCCHPVLTLETQVALTLKIVAGFTTEEIARAFLSPEKTVSQRITRAKRTIEESRLPYVVPERAELPERLAAVLAVVYLIFNEGHTTREGALMRLDLQREALRLAHVLGELLPNEPEVFGLYALIAFSFARAATRTDEHGGLLLLSEQDRARWDRPTIREGLMALERARRFGGGGGYVLQAEIAACHVTAPTSQSTDWGRILRCYDELLRLAPSPVVALNRAVAVCMHAGPTEGLAALAALEGPLARYHLFYALRADFRRRLGEDARDDYQSALALASNEGERQFLRRRMAADSPPDRPKPEE
jgi:RNA polymerase sigma-70 factor (ECF subfamily)